MGKAKVGVKPQQLRKYYIDEPSCHFRLTGKLANKDTIVIVVALSDHAK